MKKFFAIKTLGTIDNAVYVVGRFGKGETAVYVAHKNAEFERYSSVDGWIYTVAFDEINAAQ